MMKEKIVFMGNTDLSAYVLNGLIEKKYNIIATIINKKSGFSLVKKIALKNNIKVFEVEKMKDEINLFKLLGHDLIITCAFGKILPKEILQTSKIGNLNVHTSLLPKYRGASPVEHAIFNRDEKTGVSIIEMVEKMDAGDIYSVREIDVLKTDNKDSLLEKMKVISVEALTEAIERYKKNKTPMIIQNEEEVSFAPILKREDEKILLSESGNNIVGKILGLSSKPGAYLIIENKEIKILDASFIEKKHKEEIGKILKENKENFNFCVKDGFIKIKKVQLEGKKIMLAKDFFNGQMSYIGKILK